MGGRGSAYLLHIRGNDNRINKQVSEFLTDPESEYHNEMFNKLKENHISTRMSTDDVDDKILERQQVQIYNISSKYKNILKYTVSKKDIQFGIIDIKKSGTLGYCSVRLDESSSIQRIVLDKKQFNNYDKVVSEVEKGVLRGHFVPINLKFKSRDYLITHEFGHAIENSIIEKERIKHNLNDNNFDNFIRFRDIMAARIKSEVINIKNKKFANLKDSSIIEISNYSSKNDYDWFAETFTNLELSDSPKPIALALKEYLKEQNI